jgi:hypothetical protein
VRTKAEEIFAVEIYSFYFNCSFSADLCQTVIRINTVFLLVPVIQRRLAVTEVDRKNFITKHSIVSFTKLHQEKLMLWPHFGLRVTAYKARIHCIVQP